MYNSERCSMKFKTIISSAAMMMGRQVGTQVGSLAKYWGLVGIAAAAIVPLRTKSLSGKKVHSSY